MNKKEFKHLLKKIWHFIWEDESILSWIVNVVLAFVIIKFLVYPGLGLLLGTSYPVVAVVSGSMEHDGNFNQWWETQGNWYDKNGITKDEFSTYSFKNGFNKGDIMILTEVNYEKIEQGEVIVFRSTIRKDPIIHRIININKDDGFISFQTKGDHNTDSFEFERDIQKEDVLGKAVFKVPFLGYIKIGFVELLKLLHIVK